MRGGARAGSGRPPKARDTARSVVIRISMTPSEVEVLKLLAQQWDVPMGTAAYGLLADCIMKCRRQRTVGKTLPEKLVYAASRIIAQYEPRT